MLTHRGFSAWIVSEGRSVPECLVAVDENTHRVSCWIPATIGESFSIFWQDHNGGVDTTTFITLDGVTVPGRFLFGDGIASRSGVRVSKTSERPFVFAPVSEEVASTSPVSMNKEIGVITLKVKRVKRVTIRPANPIQELPSVAALGKRKAGDVRVEFGQEEQPLEEQAASTWGTVSYDEIPAGQPTSYVSFIFRYRTREFLEAQGIITEPVRRPLPTSNQDAQLTDNQHRGSSNNPPLAKPAAEFTPEPESAPSTMAKKPRLGSSSSRPSHPAINHLRSQLPDLRRTASSSIAVAAPAAPHNPYNIFYAHRSLSTPTVPLDAQYIATHISRQLPTNQGGSGTESSTESEGTSQM